DLTAYEIILGYWQAQHRVADFETFWRRSLYDGYIQNSAPAPRNLTARSSASAITAPSQSSGVEVVFRPDPTIYDGRFGNNAWLQEMDKPLSTMTWENCIWLSAAMAERMKLAPHNDVVELEVNGRKVRGLAFVQPGMPDNCVAVFTGYGHTHIGHTGNGFGYNAYEIRTADALWFANGAKLTKTGESIPLAKIQPEQIVADDWGMESRHVVEAADLDHYKRDPKFAHNGAEEPAPDETLYPNYPYNGYAWGMTIDMNSCVGCNTCIIACQAENNIPVVGKQQVLNRRAMHWLRVDTYYEGSLDNPRVYFQPLPCMQCENAPCEYVCPVAATVHSTEGLNDMVYNRCVGTRYCSNNCPYKVRRFNFLHYTDLEGTPSLKLLMNPDVTVRERGVMEKCTYCVQRIN